MKIECLRIKKSDTLKGEITIPPSKSHTLRAIIFATIAKGNSIIRNALDSTDARACIEICRKLGAEINAPANSDTWFIKGTGGNLKVSKSEINVGNSGIALRFISALVANCDKEVVITGDHSIQTNRPMQPIMEALEKLGVKAKSIKNNGFAPIAITGPIVKDKTVVLGEDSQHVSGLLMAGILARQDVVIDVINPGEKPWVEMTLNWFRKLGLRYENKNYEYYKVFGNQSIDGFDVTIPADFSSAVYPVVAALITKGSRITIKGLDMDDCQGDKEVINVLRKMGAKILIDEDDLIVKSSELHGREIDVNDFIDAAPILSVVGCFAKGITRIKNAVVARTKECNRLAVIMKELSKMGADIKETEDGLKIKNSTLNSAIVDSYGDHRMVFSLAVAALGAEGDTRINNVDCMAKTIPDFVGLTQGIGVKIKKIQNNKNIIITGLKSSGKSTIGKFVAKELSFVFIDTDEELERFYYTKTGKNLNFREIYRQLGNEGFRELEFKAINSLSDKQNCIISVGGGALMNTKVRERVKKLGYIIFIDVPKDVLYERIMQEKELPAFLSSKNPEASFKKMYNKRRPVYLANCDMTIDLSRTFIDQATEVIIQKAGELGIGK